MGIKKRNPAEKKTIKFHHLKSSNFRVIHADGVWGGLTPQMSLQMAFYSEFNSFPQSVEQELSEEGKLGGIVKREGRHGIEREFEVSVVMNLDVAKALQKWLQEKLDQAEEILQEKQKGADDDTNQDSGSE